MAPPTPTAHSSRLPSRPTGARTVTFRWAAHASSPGRARREADETLRGWAVCQQVRDDAALVASELVTNAVVHTGGDTVVCHLQDDADGVSLQVGTEGEGRTPPSSRCARPPDESGRGLLVVDALSTAWGVTEVSPERGWTLWAQVTRA